MAGHNSWSEIRRRYKCPYCGHLSANHEHISGISEVMDTDIWHCEECFQEGTSCMQLQWTVQENRKKRKKLPEPFGGGKL